MVLSKEVFLKQLNNLQNNDATTTHLYSLFVSTVKNYPDLVLKDLLTEYEALLDSSHYSLKQAGFYSLLFRLKLRKNNYLQKALKVINDFYEDADLRIWTASSVGVAYESTKNLQIIQVLWRVYKQPILSEEEDYCDWLREKILQTLLEVWLPIDASADFQSKLYGEDSEEEHTQRIQRIKLLYKLELEQIQTFLQNELANNATSKIATLHDLSTRRPLLARESIELAFLQKIQAADSLETLQSLENELNNTPTDADLITRLLRNVSEKKAFY